MAADRAGGRRRGPGRARRPHRRRRRPRRTGRVGEPRATRPEVSGVVGAVASPPSRHPGRVPGVDTGAAARVRSTTEHRRTHGRRPLRRRHRSPPDGAGAPRRRRRAVRVRRRVRTTHFRTRLSCTTLEGKPADAEPARSASTLPRTLSAAPVRGLVDRTTAPSRRRNHAPPRPGAEARLRKTPWGTPDPGPRSRAGPRSPC
jgi:hypothetical protein